MILYEDIRKANDSIKTTDIKGKAYAEVNQRIKAFRMVYPTGSIQTALVNNDGGVCIFAAEVGFHDENGNYVVLGNGTAYEREGSTFINKTSYIENCETSAVGRALGMAGFGIDTSIASYEEVETAINNQPMNEEQANYIRAVCSEENIGALVKKYRVKNLEQISYGAAKKIIEALKERENETDNS